MNKIISLLGGTFLSISLPFSAAALTTTLNFDGLPDSSHVDSVYSGFGITFSNAIALTAGVSLNEIDFPPHSGTGVIADNGSPILITLAAPVDSISAYFAYVSPLTFTAYDSDGGLLGTQNSPLSAFTGDTQLISLVFSGVSSLQIRAQTPGSYILDDFAFQPQIVPEPDPTAFFFLAALALMTRATFFPIRRKR